MRRVPKIIFGLVAPKSSSLVERLSQCSEYFCSSRYAHCRQPNQKVTAGQLGQA